MTVAKSGYWFRIHNFDPYADILGTLPTHETVTNFHKDRTEVVVM